MTDDQVTVSLVSPVVSPAAHFKHAVVHSPMPSGPAVTFVIRKDALFATDLLIQSLKAQPHIKAGNVDVEKAVKEAYAKWGHSVLIAFSHNLDYAQYGVYEMNARSLTVAFYDAPELAHHTIHNAYELAQQTNPNVPALIVSLDDMIYQADGTKFPEIAFSRLFSLDGEELDYVARPGHKPVDAQIAHIARLAKRMKLENGGPVPLVLLEDNVRRAKMLNWVIGKMEEHGVLKHAQLAGISTSFCNAKEAERRNIRYQGAVVPVVAVKDCDTNHVIDVATTRDLMFDGFVTKTDDLVGRLPGIFMDVVKRFKIAPDHADKFRSDIIAANVAFCRDIEATFGTAPQLGWFDGAPIITKVTGLPASTPMADVMRRAQTLHFTSAPANDTQPAPIPVAACKPVAP